MYESALLWIVLLPLLGAIINGVFGRTANRGLVGAVGVGSVAIAFLLAIVLFIELVQLRAATDNAPAAIVNDVYEWFRLSIGAQEIPVRVAFVFDALSGLMTLVVTGIGLLIHIYSLEYMKEDEGFARFFTYLNLFTASMLILILGSSMPVMFVGWEGVGLCSYLLIGFWYQTPAYAAAGKKAFIVNRIGDFGVLIGMFVLLMATRSLEFSEINERTFSLTGQFSLGRVEIGMTATVAALFLFLGCTGKSAQIPLYTWLPDAMAGPTPVSALIHAATMVTAGIYLCCRLSNVFILSPTAMMVISVVGALTALIAASIALAQNEMKKILAYSTVSQLGFMFAAVGAGAFAAGFFHVFTHAFFKACLFLGAGAVMHAIHAHGDADIRKLGGLAKKLPVVRMTFLLSCLAIAGVPLFSGFFSKDEILLGTLYSNGYYPEGFQWVGYLTYGILLIAATMTAFYMFRLYFVTFSGSIYRSDPPPVIAVEEEEGEEGEKGAEEAEKAAKEAAEAHEDHDGHDDHGYAKHPHRPGFAIRLALVVLAFGAVFAGFLGLPHFLGEHVNVWHNWFHDVLAMPDVPHEGLATILAMGGGILAAVVGIGLAYVMYYQGGKVPSMNRAVGFTKVLFNKWYVDELYDFVVVRPIKVLALFAATLDKYAVDGLFARASTAAVQGLGWIFTRAQTGLVYGYAAVMVAGVLVIGWWFTYPHPQLRAEPDGGAVRLTAAAGHGYEYRWDYTGDGEFDTEWSANDASIEVTSYEVGDYVGYALILRSVSTNRTEEELGSDPYVVSPAILGGGWENNPEESQGRLPTFRADLGDPDDPADDRILLRANDARARVRGQVAGEEEELSVGELVQLGAASVRVGAIVRGAVEVRNAFGNVSGGEIETVIEPRPSPSPVEPQASRLAPSIPGGGVR
ncbi:MAG: NADH-quinone oxidoreductase subunit L [Myxococcota bacterium]